MLLLWRYLFENVQTFNHDIDILTFLSIGAEVYKVLVLREIQAQVIILNSLASKYFQTLPLTGKYPPESVGYHGSIENMGNLFIIKPDLFTLKCSFTSTVTCYMLTGKWVGQLYPNLGFGMMHWFPPLARLSIQTMICYLRRNWLSFGPSCVVPYLFSMMLLWWGW